MLQVYSSSLVLRPVGKRSLQNEGSVTQLQLPAKRKQNMEFLHSLKMNTLSERKTTAVTRSSADAVENFLAGEIKEEQLSSIPTFWRKLWAFYVFLRPYSVIGTLIGVPIFCMLPVESAAELTMPFFVGFLQALTPITLMHIYVNTINQVYDVELDKVNKPYLPLASGELSMGFGIWFTAILPIVSIAMGVMFQSPPLLALVIIRLLFGSAYSVHGPFLRWKGNALLAVTCILFMRVGDHVASYMHIQKYVLGRPIVFSKAFILGTAFVFGVSAVISMYKDIPDADGDRTHGIRSLAVILGKERVFWLCVSVLLTGYAAAMIVGTTCTTLNSRLITILGHGALALSLWLRARTIDLSDNKSIHSLYMFIWKLIYAEYLLIPFIR